MQGKTGVEETKLPYLQGWQEDNAHREELVENYYKEMKMLLAES